MLANFVRQDDGPAKTLLLQPSRFLWRYVQRMDYYIIIEFNDPSSQANYNLIDHNLFGLLWQYRD